MTGQTKKILIIAAILAALFAIYWFFFRKKNEVLPVESSTGEVKALKASNMPDTDFPLQLGSNGKQVLYLQAALNISQNKSLPLDGKFGSKTETALTEVYPYTKGVLSWVMYQRIYNLYAGQINIYLKTKGLI